MARKISKAEELLALQLRAMELPLPVREYKFHPDREFRFDFAWPDRKIAVEVEGGIYGGRKTSGKSRHTTISGFENDCIKYAFAALLGWRLYRFSSGQVQKGDAIDFLVEEFKSERQ